MFFARQGARHRSFSGGISPSPFSSFRNASVIFGSNLFFDFFRTSMQSSQMEMCVLAHFSVFISLFFFLLLLLLHLFLVNTSAVYVWWRSTDLFLSANTFFIFFVLGAFSQDVRLLRPFEQCGVIRILHSIAPRLSSGISSIL